MLSTALQRPVSLLRSNHGVAHSFINSVISLSPSSATSSATYASEILNWRKRMYCRAATM
jgi:hypothetical protein